MPQTFSRMDAPPVIPATVSSPPPLQVFVVSWTGWHASSLAIATALQPCADKVTLVYSDADDALRLMAPCRTVHTPDGWFFGRKFRTCLDNCDEGVMLVITGDVFCQDWPGLVGRCRWAFQEYENLGVWAPLIDFTSWPLEKTLIGPVAGTDLSLVVQTDSIVFAMGAEVVSRMKNLNYEENHYGWGIDWAAMACCYARGMFAAVDKGIAVRHPAVTTYDNSACIGQMHDFLQQLDDSERIQYLRLQSHLRHRSGTTLPPGAELPQWSPLSGD